MVATAWAAPLICALGALAPNFSFLVATQSIGRPLGLTLDILIAVVTVEEMPRNSRAYATGVLAVLSGAGAGVAVAALPVADLGVSSWRIIYAISLIWLVVAFALSKWLPESQRFEKAHAQHTFRQHIDSALRRTLLRICSVVFLTNIFIATMSIFQNRYLKDTRGYSATLVALFTVATSSPASIGLILGGRVADERGRRVLGATMVPLGAILLASSFATSGAAMWLVAIAGGLCLGVSYPALAVYRGELFPTRTRGMAGGIIMTSALFGGIVGLLIAGWTIDSGISYGTVLLMFSVFPIIASLIVWFRYPETAHLELEQITSEN
jgi:MFS family permease